MTVFSTDEHMEVISNSIIDSRNKKSVPFLTIVVPTFKRTNTLNQTLKSLLDQTDKDFEVLVVDNDSEEEVGLATDRLINSYSSHLPVALFRNHSNVGMFGNWNKGIELSRTKWLTILHDDDCLSREYVETVKNAIKKNPDIDILCVEFVRFRGDSFPSRKNWDVNSGSKFRHIVKSILRGQSLLKIYPFDYFIRNQHAGTLGVLFKKDIAHELGNFNELLYPSGDYLFFSLYALRVGVVYFLRKPLAFYRFDENESLKKETLLKFLEYDFFVRKKIAKELGVKGFLGHFLINAFVCSQVEIYCNYFDSKDEKKSVRKLMLASLGLGNITSLMLGRIGELIFIVRRFFMLMHAKIKKDNPRL